MGTIGWWVLLSAPILVVGPYGSSGQMDSEILFFQGVAGGTCVQYQNPLSVGWASSGCHASVRWKSGLKAVRIFPYRLPDWSFMVSLRLIWHPIVDILTSTAPVFLCLCTPPALTLMKTPLHTAIINKIKIYNEIIQTVSSPSNLLKTILITLILMRELYTHLKQTPRFPVRPPTGKWKLEEE